MLRIRPTYEGSRVVDYRRLNELLQRNKRRRKLLITRKPPVELDKHNVHPIWVTKIPHPNAVSPSRLHAIEQMVWEQLQQGEADVILDAIEYLMIENGVEPTLRFVSKLRDMALLANSDFYVTISDGIDDRVRNILRRIVE
ncbi:DUF835 domain-containing protein [Thermococcus cleftensis]|uniref:DUF835 domain-containing protein n=1 Tax=Thermococcus cleftensis (strain DSM 27260 / KACC 17922 / CL1) TaxID=163003 RepID=UPI00214EE6C3|nr:DUF835 domain-containing protein [Thermococcus cleftensis]